MKRVFLILFCCIGTITLWSQTLDNGNLSSTALDRVQAQRVAFITEKIDMTSKEAEKFWPMFNEYEKEEERIRKEFMGKHKRISNMSNEEAKQLLIKRFDMDQALLDNKRKYYLQLSDIISPRKLAGFTKADREFKRLLLNRIRNKRRQGRN